MEPLVYLNGTFLPLSQASVSVMDRGFLFGDGVYEVIPVYAGKVFREQEHLERLERSLAAIALPLTMTRVQWGQLFAELIERNGPGQDLAIYLQITRGAYPKRDHSFPEQLNPTLFAMANSVQYTSDLTKVKGIRAVTLPDNRWTRCYIKTICLLPNVLLKHGAVEAGADDAILLRDGWVTESSSANVFIVKNQRLITPPKDNLLLGGVTRDLIVELGQTGAFDCQERPISEQELLAADEIWVSSSTREIVPVLELNAKPVGSGEIGLMWYNVAQQFQAYKDRLKSAN